jgi:hypothetical protein
MRKPKRGKLPPKSHDEKNCLFPCPHSRLSSAGIVSFTYYQGKKIRRRVGASDIADSETQTADYSNSESLRPWDLTSRVPKQAHPSVVASHAARQESASFAFSGRRAAVGVSVFQQRTHETQEIRMA